MIHCIDFVITPEQAKDDLFLKSKIQKELKLTNQNFQFRWMKRSIDARNKQIKVNARMEVAVEEEFPVQKVYFKPQDVSQAKSIHIIGAGPAGIFAALHAIELGLKPIVYERGKNVKDRRRDLAKISKEQYINPESNYCFGEGGAGTYSDGKLYTRSKKRGDVQKALEWFVHFGASEDILIDAHPHIGTNKLPQIMVAMREEIIKAGGEVYFESKMTDIYIDNNEVTGFEINSGTQIQCDNLILATGHSARDVYDLLHKRGVELKAKGFALGVRIEHTQELIDKIHYHGRLNDEFLPPASYSYVTQVDGKGVYSFCMCPGGIIAPCATASEEVVTNGWSPSKRNNPYSNSGIVVQIDVTDFEDYESNPFVCLNFQKEVEYACWEVAGRTQQVPAQRMKDFVDGVVSKDFPRSSYQPGIVSVDLNKVLPKSISTRLKQAFLDFDKKNPGYLTNDAVLHAPESRTSSPIQIPRNPQTFSHVEVSNLYPCAEGAGYAGGIISAAIDGMQCISQIFDK
jgi:hypothetical protein